LGAFTINSLPQIMFAYEGAVQKNTCIVENNREIDSRFCG